MSFHVGQKIIYGRAVINIDQITNESLISDQGVIIPIDSPNIVLLTDEQQHQLRTFDIEPIE